MRAVTARTGARIAARRVADDSAEPDEDAPEVLLKAWRRHRWYVGLTAAAHALTAVLIAGLGASKDWPVRVCASYSAWHVSIPEAQCGTMVNGTLNTCSVRTTFRPAGSLSPVGLLVAFSALSALFQGVPAAFTSLWLLYVGSVRRKVQTLRFTEYSISSTLMVLVLLLLNGNTDLWLLLQASAANFCVMVLGAHAEVGFALYASRPPSGRTWAGMLDSLAPHAAAWVPFIILWVQLITQFTWALGAGNVSAPSWLPVIIWGQFLLFCAFGFTQVLTALAAFGLPGWNYYRSEVLYVALSLVAKQLLVWVLYSGIIVRKEVALLSVSMC